MNDAAQAQPEMTDEQLIEGLKGCTDAQLVEYFLNFRQFLEREAEAQSTYVAPHVKKQGMVQAELHRRLLERNPGWQPGMKASGSTDAGTFFLKTDNSLKVADREAYWQWLTDTNNMPPGLSAQQVGAAILGRLRQFSTAHVAKEGVESYLEQIEQYRKDHGGALPPGITSELPPGITLDRIAKLQVRKA